MNESLSIDRLKLGQDSADFFTYPRPFWQITLF